MSKYMSILPIFAHSCAFFVMLILAGNSQNGQKCPLPKKLVSNQ